MPNKSDKPIDLQADLDTRQAAELQEALADADKQTPLKNKQSLRK